MKKNNSIRVFLCLLIVLSLSAPVLAQKGRKPIIFAVLNDGKLFEPIAYVEKGKLTAPVDGGGVAEEIELFSKTYYKPKSVYRLIFGGANAGTATVLNSLSKSDCARNMAEISVTSSKTKLAGFVFALATDAPATKKAVSGLRRKPTPAERAVIEGMVRADFANRKVSATAIKSLNYHNLTALDVNNDKKAELVGSFWVNLSKTERGLLFFIAEKNSAGKYEFGYKNYRVIKQEEVMSRDIKNIDEGIYHELLLDAYDYDSDGVSEIFTYAESFEGAGFFAYKRENGRWGTVFEFQNYHCGY